MLRIGLTQRVEVVADRDERRDCLDQAWTSLLTENGCWPIPIPNRVADVAPLLGELGLDGVIITGGNDLARLPGARTAAAERDALELRLLEACSAKRLPVLGVCRGLQFMVCHYGGKVVPVAEHAATRHGLKVRSAAHFLLTDRQEVNSFHDFGCYEADVGLDLEVVAAAPDGTVEAVAHRALPQWAIMWHPERPPHDKRDAALLRGLFSRGHR